MRFSEIAKRIVLISGVFCLIFALVACGSAKTDETDKSDLPDRPVVSDASTEGLIYAEKKDGTLSVVGYEGTDAAVTISVYNGKPVSEIATGAFSANHTIKTVTLGASVGEIGVAAFADCVELTDVNAAASCVVRVANAAFLGCESLVHISLPATLENIGVDAFLGCDALTALSFGGSGEAWLGIAIGAHNEAIEDTVVLSDGQPFNSLQAGSCSSTVHFSLNKDGLLTISGKGHVPDYPMGETPWSAFAASIKAVSVEEGIDIVGKNAFAGCKNLMSVTFAQSVRLIDDNAFYGCEKLAALTLPANLRRIGDTAFYGCAQLRAVIIPDTVTMVGASAFMNCARLADVTLSAGMTTLSHWTFSGCERLTAITIPAAITEIGTGAFYGCEYLSEVTFAGAPTLIKKSAFAGCGRLASVTAADWSGLTVMDNNQPFVAAKK